MKNLIEDLYHDVLHAPTVEALKVELVKFAEKQGFDLVSADYHTPTPNSSWISINNYPRGWLDIRSELCSELPDQFVSSNLTKPELWDIDDYKSFGAHRNVEALTFHGFYAGIEVPVLISTNSKLFIDVARSQPLPISPPEIVRIIGEVQLFGTFAWSALERLFAPMVLAERPRLTTKEFEVMKWTVAGKTAYEVGQILACSERTANFHLQNIFRKLNVVNKQAAIARALEWKLVV